MSLEAAMHHLEQVCQVFSSNPQQVAQELMELRKRHDGLAIAQYTLQHSSVAAAKFHAVSVLQGAALDQWETMAESDRLGWRNFVAQYLLDHYHRSETFVSSQLLQAFAVLWKRTWSEESSDTKTNLFNQIHQLGAERPVLATKFLLSLVGEFSTSKSAALGLPLHFHHRAHREFENCGLLQCLELALRLLLNTIQALLAIPPSEIPTPTNRELVSQFEAVLSLCVEILSWDFGDFDPLHDTSTAPAFITPPILWRPLLLRPDLLLPTALVEAYCHVRSVLSTTTGSAVEALSRAAHLLRQILTQLISLSGPIFTSKDEKANHASFLLQRCTALVADSLSTAVAALESHDEARLEALGVETLALAQVLQLGVCNFHLPLLATFPFFRELVGEWARLTQQLLETTARTAVMARGNGAGATGGQGHPSVDLDEVVEHGWAMEAFEQLLDAWVVMVEDPSLGVVHADDGGPRDFDVEGVRNVLTTATAPLYPTFLLCKITLGRIEAEKSELEEEEEDEAGGYMEADAHEQYQSMACLGRLDPASSLVALQQMLDSSGDGGCLNRLQRLYETGGTGVATTEVSALMEEIRVLVLACGHLLADDTEGEHPVIPEPLHRLCFKDHAFSTLLTSTISKLLLLSNFQLQYIMKDPHSHLLSPYLNETILWFLHRWARTYLAPDPSAHHNKVVAPPLLQAYGTSPGQGGLHVLDGLLQCAWAFICYWPSQQEVCRNACHLLRALLSPIVGPHTMTLQHWHLILNALHSEAQDLHHRPPPQSGDGHRRLPPDIKGLLLEVLACGILAREDDPQAPGAFSQLSKPVEARLQALLVLLRGGGRGGEVLQQAEVVCCLYMGLARAIDSSNRRLLSSFITNSLPHLVELARQCHNYPTILYSVLLCLRDYAEVQISSLQAYETMALLKASWDVLQIYATQNHGQRRGDANADEETYADVLCVLKLLSYLATKDFVDFSDASQGTMTATTISDVVLFGLQQVTPLMKEDLLRFPSLAKQFFTLVSFMVDTYTDRVAQLDHPLFLQLLGAVIFGFQHPDSEIARDSLRAMAGLAHFHVRAMLTSSSPGLSHHLEQKGDLFSDCLRKLLQMVVFESSIWDRLEACANAILMLILCDREGFLRMVGAILDSQPPPVRQRLEMEFQELYRAVPPPTTRVDRQAKITFKERLKVFATRVRPFLQLR